MTTPRELIVSSATAYLFEAVSFDDLYQLAGDLLPLAVDSDAEATELIGAIFAAEAEIQAGNAAVRNALRKSAIGRALVELAHRSFITIRLGRLTHTTNDSSSANRIKMRQAPVLAGA